MSQSNGNISVLAAELEKKATMTELTQKTMEKKKKKEPLVAPLHVTFSTQQRVFYQKD